MTKWNVQAWLPGAEITSMERMAVAGLGTSARGSWKSLSPTLPMKTVVPADSQSRSSAAFR